MSKKDLNLTNVDKFSLMMYYKRYVVKISLFIGMPLLCAIAIHNFIEGGYFVAVLSCVMFLILVLLGFMVTRRIDEKLEYKIYSILFRLFAAAGGIALLYGIGFLSNFSRIEWCYIYPILAFFAVGLKEGVIWVSIFYGILAFFMLNFDLQGVTLFQLQQLRIRFLISLFAVSTLSFFLEYGFRLAQRRLLHHQGILKESEDRYRDLVERSQYLICTHDLQGKILSVNQEGARLLGYNQRDLLNKNIRDFLMPGVRDKFTTYLDTIQKHGVAQGLMLIQTASGKGRIWEYNNTLRTEGIPSPIVRAMAHDITERKQTEDKLRESEERFRELAENVREVFYIYTQEMQELLYISPAYMEIWGHPCQSLYEKPQSLWDPIHPEDKDRVIKSLKKKSEEEIEEVYRIVRPDGTLRWIKERSFPIYDDSGKARRIVGIAADITDLKIGEENLRYLSLHDSLTGLYNRIYFEEEISRLEKARYHNNTIGIISCDVDGLKLVNDTLGHDHGDDLLLAAARVIQESFREEDLVARIGGDEFAVILSNTTESAVENACQRVQKAVSRYNTTTPELPLSISIGFAVKNKNDSLKSLKDVFKEADSNMYREKLSRIQSVRSTFLNTLINTLKARDLTTDKHVMHLEKLLTHMAVSLGLHESVISDLSLLGKFHDIGKVGISDAILFKEGPLTSEEWTEMKRHCEIGYRIALSAPDLVPIADWILKHHEWWNGHGYPLGIKGEEIPIECRLLAMTDAYVAMTSVRPYRRAFSHEEAIAELQRCSGTQFDPELLEIFLRILETHALKS